MHNRLKRRQFFSEFYLDRYLWSIGPWYSRHGYRHKFGLDFGPFHYNFGFLAGSYFKTYTIEEDDN